MQLQFLCHMFMAQGRKVVLFACLHGNLSLGLVPVIWPVHQTQLNYLVPLEKNIATGSCWKAMERSKVTSVVILRLKVVLTASKVADWFIKYLIFPFSPPFLFVNCWTLLLSSVRISRVSFIKQLCKYFSLAQLELLFRFYLFNVIPLIVMVTRMMHIGQANPEEGYTLVTFPECWCLIPWGK